MGRPAGPGSFASLAHARMNWHTPSQMTSKLSVRVRRRLVVGGWSSPLAWWPMGHPWRATVLLSFPPARAVALGRLVGTDSPARLRRLADLQIHEVGRSRRSCPDGTNEEKRQPAAGKSRPRVCIGRGTRLYYGVLCTQHRHSVRCPSAREGTAADDAAQRQPRHRKHMHAGHGAPGDPRTVSASPSVLLRTANSCPMYHVIGKG